MIALYKKEISLFFSSLTGYLVVGFFVVTSGLFLWVLPGQFNLLQGGYSTLEPFFALAPWIYLFLVPAITMRFIAEERRNGTLEILLTQPISELELIVAKFLSGVTLVALSLLPVILYYYSVYQLGNPIGNIDVGATWGSFIGLLLLTVVYVAIGLFSSSLTDNQVVAFVVSIALSFLFYNGIAQIGDMPLFDSGQQIFEFMSIDSHYSALSRGVVDVRDVIYFISLTSLFLYFSKLNLKIGR